MACSTSYCSITLPFTAAAPRLFTDETCAPAMLTNAEVISSPEVDSAFFTERVIACEAAARSTMMPFLMPSDGSMPTPRIRMDLSSSTRPTRVQILVVPTSMPTTISSISPFCSIGGRVGERFSRTYRDHLCFLPVCLFPCLLSTLGLGTAANDHRRLLDQRNLTVSS